VTTVNSPRGSGTWQIIAPTIPLPTPECLRWAVITTPTCNVCARGPGARCATVQVSPVVPLREPYFTPSQIIAVAKHEMVDFIRLTNPPAPGQWAIDQVLLAGGQWWTAIVQILSRYGPVWMWEAHRAG
jgi:hypothetical protein